MSPPTNPKTLTLVCPVYNEEQVILLFYEKLRAVLDKDCKRYEWIILFVLDRSSDKSLEILRNITTKDSRVRVILLSQRFGHQMSLVAGIDHSDSDALIMMDSDLQHPPELIPQLLKAFEDGHDVVYTIRNSKENGGKIKNFLSRKFYSVINLLSGLRLSEGEADFRLISRRVVDLFKNEIREQNQFLRGLFYWVGFDRVGIEYTANPRAYGKSKYSWALMFKFASTGIISFSKRPIEYAVFFGLIFFKFSMLSVVYLIFNYVFNQDLPSGWTTIVVLVTFFGGIQLLFIGILGIYLGYIFDEVKARPLYVIDEKINFSSKD